MDVLSRLSERYRQLMLRISIFDRVLIGNSIIIIFGAVAGTIFTREMTLLGNIRLILLFSFAGILITLLVNRVIIKTALYPLHELGDALEQVNSGQINIPDSLKNYKDPDIRRLVIAIDSMLNRIANHTSQLRAISERAINAQEEERVRIARSLHDDTAQSISMLIIHLERLENLIPAGAPDVTRYISDAQHVATKLLENLRKIIWDLRPSILDDLGLFSAIRWFARTNLEKGGVKVDFCAPLKSQGCHPILKPCYSVLLRKPSAIFCVTRMPARFPSVCGQQMNRSGWKLKIMDAASISKKPPVARLIKSSLAYWESRNVPH